MTTISTSDIPHLLAWVASKNKPFTIFDIETTGFHRENDRLVEIGMICVHPNGNIQHSGCYINPERAIPPVASRIHGIYDHHVCNESNFLRVLPYFKKAFSNHIIGGFNTSQFDVGFMIGNSRVYGDELPTPECQLDLRDLWKTITQKSAGKLGDVADHFNVVKGTAHRAIGDVETTIRIYEAMLVMYGPSFFDTMLDPKKQKERQENVKRQTKRQEMRRQIVDGIHTAIVEYGRFGDDEMRNVAATLNVSMTDISFAISDYLSEHPDHMDFFKKEEEQNFLKSVLGDYLKKTEDRKLKPMREYLIEHHQREIDYVQIRLALIYFQQLIPVPTMAPSPQV